MDCECLLADGKRVDAARFEAVGHLRPSHLIREKFGPQARVFRRAGLREPPSTIAGYLLSNEKDEWGGSLWLDGREVVMDWSGTGWAQNGHTLGTNLSWSKNNQHCESAKAC